MGAGFPSPETDTVYKLGYTFSPRDFQGKQADFGPVAPEKTQRITLPIPVFCSNATHAPDPVTGRHHRMVVVGGAGENGEGVGGIGGPGGRGVGAAGRRAIPASASAAWRRAWIMLGTPRASIRSAWAWVAAQRASSWAFSSWISRWRACWTRVRSVWPASKRRSRLATSPASSWVRPEESLTSAGRPVPLGDGRPDLGDGPLLGLLVGDHRPALLGLALADQGLAVVEDRQGRHEVEADVLDARPRPGRTAGR